MHVDACLQVVQSRLQTYVIILVRSGHHLISGRNPNALAGQAAGYFPAFLLSTKGCDQPCVYWSLV
jgi:hypothetical protein